MEKRVGIGQYIDKEFGIIYGGSIGEETIVLHSERENRIGGEDTGFGSSPDYVTTTVPLYYPAYEGLIISMTRTLAIRTKNKELSITVRNLDFLNGSLLVKVEKY